MRFDYATYTAPNWWSTLEGSFAIASEHAMFEHAKERGWELVAVIGEIRIGRVFYFKRPCD